MSKHDPETCGVNAQTDCEECQPRTIQLRRLEHLEARLRKADIFVRDLAELIWIWLDDLIDERLRRIATELLVDERIGRIAEDRVRQLLWRLSKSAW